ncbi:ABC-type cobalt transport system, permease component family protein [Anoxybacillus sp. B7M1]|jgi:energy-coupling factor transport system permease protein|uniref:ECF transporter S component n=1 Tax=Anoxybacteroides rupiense TaxID=311460 RepID=A0ABD5IXU7_9BACL|nr:MULTISPECIES: ECF transporter S component [Anoxybacillus]ANB57516.1 ABC-type cobalt transport system, permease component family protein [Anoxybacillus sp. B2M1]ANB62814.1 ABC-type cobalt transport system, permease component family protein [Anoxybacillus sp. B7M1]KXG10036.1 putative HMP/thiamine permease protein YkoE [Anoxybacillus sp. P3H1B]MBB3907634.1 energy-coupling factor transport system substrate-specific component [Anoxybacillus rupiensis]MDE8564206.1 ECF transporter S component [Ano
MQTTKGLKLADILITIVISIVFGIVYKLWGPFYYFVKPFGFHLDQLIYGMWFIAATVAFLIIRKPGIALLAEIAASSSEFVTGSEWGLEVLIYGVVQGLFAELAFAAFRYKRFDVFVVSLAAIGSTIGSLIMDYYKGYIEALAPWNLTLFFVARFVGAILISGVFASSLVKALEATGVTQMVRSASKEDYDQLDR